MEKGIPNLTAFGALMVAGLPLPDSATPDYRALLGFYEKNKFPLLAFKNGRNGHAFLHSPEFKAARNGNSARLKALRSEYLIVRDRWAERGIPCITLKSGGSFLPFPYTSDNLDILIHKEDESAARDILLQLGYLELKNLEEPQKFLFRKFHAGTTVSDIHLHTRIGWGVGFMNENDLWRKAIVSPDDAAVTIPSPDDTILITLAHAFYENKCLRLADLIKVFSGFQGVYDWDYIKNTAARAGWQDGLYFSLGLCAHLEQSILGKTAIPHYVIEDCESHLAKSSFINRYYRQLKSRTPVLPFYVSFIFGKLIFYKKIMQDPRYSLKKRLYETARTTLRGIRLKAHIRPQSPFLVTFSGLDGSGKTQHAKILQSCLNACGLKTEYYWSRCGTAGLTRFFTGLANKILGKKTARGDSKPGAEGRSARLQNPIFRFIWTYLAAFDIMIAYLRHVRLPLLRGRIVICDRYVYDAAAEMESSLVKVNWLHRLALKMMLAGTPKPDIAYFLDVPEAVSTQRKDASTDIEYLRQLRRNYLRLTQRYHLATKDTARELETIADEIVLEVGAPYMKIYPTFINSLFLSNPNQINLKSRKVK
ncbi:MAG: nucleotidyltransferase family protein [Dehalococcoidales bacterium]|jgi:dTMP kinase